jgi:hypothetical protein
VTEEEEECERSAFRRGCVGYLRYSALLGVVRLWIVRRDSETSLRRMTVREHGHGPTRAYGGFSEIEAPSRWGCNDAVGGQMDAYRDVEDVNCLTVASTGG